MQAPHSNALPCSPPIGKAAEPNPRSLSTAPSPLWGWGGAEKGNDHRREVKGQGCLVYSPHLPGKGSSTHRRPPASRICIHRAAFEQGTHCTTAGKNCQEMQTTIAEWERIPALRDLSLSTSPLRNSSYDHTGHNNYSSYIFLTVGL